MFCRSRPWHSRTDRGRPRCNIADVAVRCSTQRDAIQKKVRRIMNIRVKRILAARRVLDRSCGRPRRGAGPEQAARPDAARRGRGDASRVREGRGPDGLPLGLADGEHDPSPRRDHTGAAPGTAQRRAAGRAARPDRNAERLHRPGGSVCYLPQSGRGLRPGPLLPRRRPVVIQVPDFGSRFWVYALYDAPPMWACQVRYPTTIKNQHVADLAGASGVRVRREAEACISTTDVPDESLW